MLKSIAIILAALAAAAHVGQLRADTPVTGVGNPAIDSAVLEFMDEYEVPGLSLALVRNGRLVVARGYGVTDNQTGEPVTPQHRFRLASVSKPITATALMKLEEAGHVSLDDSALGQWLPEQLAMVPAGRRTQAGLITVQQLLNQTSGWNFRATNRELVFEQRDVAEFMGVPSPPSAETMIDYAMGFERLRTPPGNEFAYENFNYMLLGRVVESVTGRDYEDFVRSQVLAPLGIHGMKVGESLQSALGDDEVRYHTRGIDDVMALSVYDPSPGQVPVQYGGWDQQTIDALGGWTASSVELARLLSALDGNARVPDILGANTIMRMGEEPPPPAGWANDDAWYGLGWYRRDNLYFHDGSLPGTATIAAFNFGGNAIVALMNTREDGLGDQLSQVLFPIFVNPASWPNEDLFDDYGLNDFVVRDELSGAWFDPAHDGEGFILEMLDSRTAVVYWFTYDTQGRQRWFIGVGEAGGGSIEVAELLEISGGRFGSAPNTVSENRVGSLTLAFEDCDNATASYEVDGQAGSQDLIRLLNINGRDCAAPGDDVQLVATVAEGASGNWFRPGDPGEGMIFERLGDDSAVLFWFTFDDEGNPAWMVGVGENIGGKWVFSDLEITSGGKFGPGFDPNDVVRETWGSIELDLECLSGSSSYAAQVDGFASEALPVSRLTWLAGQRPTDC